MVTILISGRQECCETVVFMGRLDRENATRVDCVLTQHKDRTSDSKMSHFLFAISQSQGDEHHMTMWESCRGI